MKPQTRKVSPRLATSTNCCHLNLPSTSPSVSFFRLICILLGCFLFPSQSFSISNINAHRMRSVLQRRHLLSGSVRAALKQQPNHHRGALSSLSLRLQTPSHQPPSTYSTTRLFTSTPSVMDVMEMDNNTENKNYTPYEKWVRRLYLTNLFHPVKMGLTNMRTLHQLMGSPMDQPNVVVIHIAGTNGKGSVALKIANTLQAHGLNVGLFCSPHVSSFRERMQVNGEMISEQQVVEMLPQIYTMCQEHDIPATFFEITTALAFMFYAQQKTQVVVLETGLGGRLDATNVITSPAMSIITSIGLEHTRILGDTIELIAREKGGIIKPGRPVLCGPHVPHQVLRDCTKELGGGEYYTPDVVLGTLEDMSITDYDEENQRVSKAALVLLQELHPELVANLTPAEMDAGVVIRPPCRFELVPRDDDLTVILDVAHNPPAMEYLVRKLKKTFPDAAYRFVVGMSSDKDLSKCGRSILTVTDPSRIHLVEAQHPRAAKLEAILDAEPRLQACHVDLEDRSITKQVEAALALAKEQPGEILVVCGSVFLMAEAREALGFDEPRDSDAIAEVAGAGTRNMQDNFGNTTDTDTKEK